MYKPIPEPNPQAGLHALRAMLREKHPLAAMQVFHASLGDVFRIKLPGFAPVVLVGPQAAHFVLVEERGSMRWRNEQDPVTDLLRHGVLVEDGDEHDQLRRLMNPSMHRRRLLGYEESMLQAVDQVTAEWRSAQTYDMLVEMRKITLLILMRTLFGEDFSPHLQRLWAAVLRSIQYISPGIWMFWRSAPRPQYRRAIVQINSYLYEIIQSRRQELDQGRPDQDLLDELIHAGLKDDLIRDQLLTMLIAGHDTSTALLSWSLAMMGLHPEIMRQSQTEVDQTLGGLPPLGEMLSQLVLIQQVMQESLRLYPPIHLGSRLAAADLEYDGYLIPKGTRVIYSIYLTQRHPGYWTDPDRFDPQRWTGAAKPAPYTWLAFGGGPRNCIGSAFGQVETRLILARLLQRFDLELVEKEIHLHMGATLEPRPGVRMRVSTR